jgi:cephalosporin hydroxylase
MGPGSAASAPIMPDTNPVTRLARALHHHLAPGCSRALLAAARALKLPIVAAGAGADDLALEWTRTLWQTELWRGNHWLGMPILQWPTDLLVLQELIVEQAPRVILETGTYRGGSAIFFASMLELAGIGDGLVISIDAHHPASVRHAIREHRLGSRVRLIEGDAVAPETVAAAGALMGDEQRVLVFLDSDHSYRHVASELSHYQRFVPVGGYLCVFDTIMRDLWDLPLAERRWQTDNPHRAVREFVAANRNFEVDATRNRLRVSFAPDGFLRRMA